MRKRRMKKRVLAAVMTACMAAGAVPGVTFAENGIPVDSLSPGTQRYTFDGTPTTEEDADIQISKDAVYNEDTDDYTIMLKASAKSQITTKPTEIVIVLDKSGSMAWCTEKNPGHNHRGGSPCEPVRNGSEESRWTIAKNAISSMTSALAGKATFKYVVFDGDAYICESDFKYNWHGMSFDYEPEGSTNLVAGVNKGIEQFSESEDSNKVLVIVADGEPDRNIFPTEQANAFKNASENNVIYTVGFAYDAAGGPFKDLASGDDYFLEANDSTELNEKMTEISKNIPGLIVDPLGTQVEYVDGSLETSSTQVPASYDHNTINWSDDQNGLAGTVALTYRVKVKDSVKEDFDHADEIYLNGKAELNYSYLDENGEVQRPKAISFEIPKVQTSILNVEYKDENDKLIKTEKEKVILNEKNTLFRTTLDDINDFDMTEGTDTKTYYVTEKPEAIPQPEAGEIMTVTVRVSTTNPQQKYTVLYKSEGIPETSVKLPAAAEYLEGENVTIIEAPEAEGYTFSGWKYEGIEETDVEDGRFKMPKHPVTLTAVYEKNAEPEIPDLPTKEDFPSVVVTCVNENRTHETVAEAYPIDDEFELGNVRMEEDGTFTCDVTVHGWYYASKFNADCGLKHPVTVCDTSFTMKWNAEKEAWEAPAATSIEPIKVDCTGKEEPQDPDLPGYEELKDLIGSVVLVHTGSNAEHADAEYELLEGSYTIASASNARAAVTVKADSYVEAYNEENGEHTVQGSSSARFIFAYGENGWEIEKGETPVTFTVKCSGKTPEEPEIPEKPELPDYEDLKKIFGKSVTVTCITNADHDAEQFELMAGSYSVTRSKDDDNEAVVTVRSDSYIKSFADGMHTNAGNDAARVTLVYDKEDGKWYAAEEIQIGFQAKCEKKDPEKQYAEIRFVVVNGTFTENGKTELTKSFEVGTKLTIADIPATVGMNSHYSDETWDKYPIGYVVEAEGTTFTITYKWKSSGGSSSGGGGGSSSGSTRKYATDASGKNGRWILEGGEFTENNGRLPSNEYLKIGDTIYGFYTYGFAIDFDRPEYYTDAAIQAKGGYRDAEGTWRLNGWWFCYDDGTFPHGEWKYLTWDGRSDWYYFDVDGWMEDGWLRWNNNWYYLHTKYDNTRGHMYTGWHEIDGKWYYFNTASDKGTLGAMLADTTTPDGFTVGPDGAWIK